ncbi:alpha-glucosidase [Promineifilum sp.]|uniref:glycoside hydrolase family 13 protein n=1 Tax=Promineifilum sp. TaxID=2664178 RepID=UPI0035B4430B
MKHTPWWQTAVFYQIYPRSFADGNGDGIGDFAGLIDKLDYLQDLGIDAIWLSPHYASPQFDCGYDIADYLSPAEEYGTLDEFKRFLDGAHARGIRIILDLVLNHTSDQHQWFIDSRSSRDHPKRDWYIWRDGRDGGPPNNWHAAFSDSAWEYDAATGQYYYHYFFKEQPDLNWRNPEVKRAMFDAARFWLDLGVDGFRLDAIGTLFEDPTLADHTAEMSQRDLFRELRDSFPSQTDTEHARYLAEQFRRLIEKQVDQPGVHELMRELRALVDEYDDRVLVGETDEISYYGDGDNELHLTFNFPLMRAARLTPAWILANQAERLAALPPGAWPCNTLGNHDSPRVLSRYADGRDPDALARLHLALMLTLRGTPFLYNGEEIGMGDWPLADIGQFRDNLGVWRYQMIMAEADEGRIDALDVNEALALANNFSRDKGRTPMQWRNAPNGGFTPAGVAPWLPVHPNYAQGVNVADQANDPGSMLNFYRAMLRLRRRTPALILGDFEPLNAPADCLVFLRRTKAQRCLVALNFSEEPQTLDLGGVARFARSLWKAEEQGGGGAGEMIDLSRLMLTPFGIYIGELDE